MGREPCTARDNAAGLILAVGSEGRMKGRQYSIYELLEEIRPRPALYFGVKSILHLRTFVEGFVFAARKFDIADGSEPNFHDEFHDWVARKFRWNESTAGWANIILAESGGDDVVVDRFYELLDEFRARPSM